MSKQEAFKELLLCNFSTAKEILQIENREVFYITDYKEQSYIVFEYNEFDSTISFQINDKLEKIENINEDNLFKITNNTQTIFVPIDGKKGLLQDGNSKCDFIIFDEFTVCFVEVKLNATSIKKITKNRYKAVDQISKTIYAFDKKLNKDYKGLQREGYICTPITYPRQNAEWISLAVEFLEQHGIPVYETNIKIAQR